MGRPVEVEDSSRTKVEIPRQEEETTKEVNFEKATMSKEKVPIATEGSKERSCEPNTEEEEKKMLQKLAQGLERMSVEQNEYVTTLKEEYNSRTLKRRRTLESNDA